MAIPNVPMKDELDFAAEDMLIKAFKSSPQFKNMLKTIKQEMREIESKAKKVVIMNMMQTNLKFKVESPHGKFKRQPISA